MNRSSLFNAYRQLRPTFPYKEQRKRFIELRSGPTSLFIWKDSLKRWEINSIEYTVRLMAF